MEKTINQAANEKLQNSPHLFWAKKFDTSVHIPAVNFSGTLCGSVAALLGNNYSEEKRHLGICPKCLDAAERTNHPLLT